jgi:beta-lactamase regulating signal transducer with metallopeptidase domain
MWENSTEIFNWLLRASLYSVPVIFIVVLTQKLTRRVLSPRWSYALWLILLARLLLPAGPETGWSLWNLTTQERWAHWTASGTGGEEAANITIPPAVSDAASYHEESLQSGENRVSQSIYGFFAGGIKQALFIIWLIGVLTMFAAAAFVNLRLWNSVRGLNPTTDTKLLELFEDCKRRMRVKTMTGLVVTDRVENPFLFGFIRPRVILPADLVRQASSCQLSCVLLHELAHLKRGDIMTGWLITFLQSLHWFNPVIWWAFYRMRFDRETACDALVLSRMSDETRGNYGDALIGMMERFNHPHRLPAIVAGIFENKEQLKRRLIMISKFRSPLRREIITFAALLAVLSIALLTEPRQLLSQSDEQSADAQNGITADEVKTSEPRRIIIFRDGTDVQQAEGSGEPQTSSIRGGKGQIVNYQAGMSVNDIRFATNGETADNPNMEQVGEFSMVLNPVSPDGITNKNIGVRFSVGMTDSVSEDDMQQMLSKIKEQIVNNPDAIEVNEVRFRSGTITDAQNGINPVPVGVFRMVLRPGGPDSETKFQIPPNGGQIYYIQDATFKGAIQVTRTDGVGGSKGPDSVVYGGGKAGDIPQNLPELFKDRFPDPSEISWEEVSPGFWKAQTK